jgi:hypothetical protein
MGWHGQDPSAITDIKAFEIEQFAATKLYPEVKKNVMSTFSLIFFQVDILLDITTGLRAVRDQDLTTFEILPRKKGGSASIKRSLLNLKTILSGRNIHDVNA